MTLLQSLNHISADKLVHDDTPRIGTLQLRPFLVTEIILEPRLALPATGFGSSRMLSRLFNQINPMSQAARNSCQRKCRSTSPQLETEPTPRDTWSASAVLLRSLHTQADTSFRPDKVAMFG